MKNLIKRLLPKKVYLYIRKIKIIYALFTNYFYDFSRYIRYSSGLNDKSQLKLEAKITKTYHVLEKGIGMVNPRKGFGKDKAEQLIDLLQRYKNSGYPMDRSQIKSAIIVLNEYFIFNGDVEERRLKYLKEKSRSLIENFSDSAFNGGVIPLKKEEILKDSKGDFQALAFSRYSIRNFSSKEVDLINIKEAIKIAQKTPSVCNRQSSRTYVIKSKETINKVLSLQNGNRGFGHLINTVIIVTSDLNAFAEANERNQSFIDGGMYSMSLLYAIHYVGLGSCPLNWSVVKGEDKELRRVTGIKESENIIMIIGVGHLPDQFKVGVSERKTIEEVITVI
ncbi:nitroreductase [Lysinibacillus yapensis]|uniref:Nitroreductase n=1 Tax=Ureibacillus yapensis TaxID=2304605 RepID=A0A396SE43_9BACL|nr:nitroreductase family protein [Lysinibacillus yapensis]RHW39555.1 nitroreductase [Lysinibacillus yapensis]